MTANDTATRRVTTGIVLAVGLFVGSDSYSHIYTLARDHGQAIVSAALLPLAGDGLIAAASSAMLVASRQGRDVPVLARVMLLAGIGATLAFSRAGLAFADDIPFLAIARAHALRVVPITEMRQLNAAHRNADQVLALLADQLAFGEELAQILPDPALDDLPETLVIFFDLEDHGDIVD